MQRWVGRVALVTGASTGIGEGITRSLVKHGMRVVGCGRNVDKIKAIQAELKGCSGSLFPVKCDVSKEDEIMSMFAQIKKGVGGVDVCVNNAGLGIYSPFLEAKVESWRNMLDVNVVALCLCSREAVRSMREREVDDGQIINISSIRGHILPVGATIGNAFYSATKFAVSALTEGLRQELREKNSNIRVAAISPGAVETEFAYRNFNDPVKAQKYYSSMHCLQAEDIAQFVVNILSAPPHVQINDIIVLPINQNY